MNNIPDLLNSRKTKDALLILVIILLGVFSFGLGRLSAIKENHTQVKLCNEENYKENNITSNSGSNEKSNVKENYVASKTGKAYHLPWCSGARRIKDENKIWFNTKEEAENAGYKPASNCKGI